MNSTAPTAKALAVFLRENHVRLLLAGVIVALLTLVVTGGKPLLLGLLIGPAIVGGLVGLGGLAALHEWVDGRRRTFAGIESWAAPRSGTFAKNFAGPVGRGSTWVWDRTDNIGDPSLRCGVRITAALYLWAAMLAILAATAYIALAVLLLVLVVGLASWIISLGSSDDSAPDGGVRSRSANADGLMGAGFLPSQGDNKPRRVYSKTGLFSEEEVGRVDADGRVYERTGLFSEDEVGRIDDSGRVYEKTGLFSEEETHRIAGDGRIFKKTGLFSEEEVGRTDESGRVYKKTGMFSEEEVGRVADT